MSIKQPILTSDRLLIRPHKIKDIEPLNEAILNSFDYLHQWMDWASAPPSVDDTRKFVEFCINNWSSKESDELPLLIFDKEEKNLIGSSGFHDVNWAVPHFEIGYWCNQKFLRQGCITEAVNMITRYLFIELKAKRVEIRCDIKNVNSIGVAKKLGFQQEALFKKHRIYPGTGEISDTLVYARYDLDRLPEISNFRISLV